MLSQLYTAFMVWLIVNELFAIAMFELGDRRASRHD